ncbi:MAG: type II secretion system F family protein, partial [Puniceicoccales bacterium]|nr:type II secretion system F family protein [Puniceicoccales bacterium]
LLTILVIPRFENVIADQIGPDAMPGLTKIILQVSQFIAAHWIAVLSLATTVFFMAVTANKIAIIKRIIYSFLLRTPLIGDCIKKWCVVLFARTFGYLLVCGCSLMESLKMAQKSVDNYQMKDNLTLTINDVQQGMSLSESLHRHNIFPAMAEGLIKIGEESGKLGEMLNKVSSSYEEQLNELITRITSLIEPFLIVFLAVFVGSVVIGLFLPLVSLIQNITG